MDNFLKSFFLRLTTCPILEPLKRKFININFNIQKLNKAIFYNPYQELFHTKDKKKNKKHKKKYKKRF